MTALSQYQRIEAAGLWRMTPQDQRRDVVVSMGDATLTISDMRDQALTHWSLPAVVRANPGQSPAIYHPHGDPGETLELAEGEDAMIAAIEKLRTAISRQRPRPGRLRLTALLASFLAVVGLGVFWLPDAVVRHTVSVVPQVKRTAIGDALLTRILRVTGQPCSDGASTPVLARLATRLPAPRGKTRLTVLRSGLPSNAVHLPGGRILVSRAMLEDYDEPDVVAGVIVAEHLRAQLDDPLARMLHTTGLLASFRLLTTGALSEQNLQDYAEFLLTQDPVAIPTPTLLAGFKAWNVRATPYAYALDPSGESTLSLIEADPFISETPPPILSDGDWIRLQSICSS